MERKAPSCSPRKSAQSDKTSSSLAQLVTGTGGSQHLKEGGHDNPAFLAEVVVDHPTHSYPSSSPSKFEESLGAPIYPYSGAWLRHPLNIENSSYRRQRRCSGVWKLRWMFVVSLLAFLSASALAYCVYLHGRLKHQDNEIEVILKALQDSVVQHNGGRESGAVFETDFTRNRTKRDNSASAAHYFRNLIRGYLSEMPMVHLRGMYKESTEWTSGHDLLWQEDPSSTRGIAYNTNAIRLKYHEDANNRVKGIQVLQPGVYLIYSQVVIDGIRSASSGYGVRSDCTHETVRLDHQEQGHILMKSYLTQDSHGEPISDGTTIPRFPRDTSFHMGLFQLHRQDEIRVRTPYHDNECQLVNVTSRDFDAAYFGLLKIG